MTDTAFRVDSAEDILFIALTVLVVAAAFVYSGNLDSHARFAAADVTAYVSAPAPNESVTFTQEQVDLLNEVSRNSLGYDPVADERLYCFGVRDRRVQDLRVADSIEASAPDSISGSCVSQFGIGVDGFIHTHPAYSDELSAEDRNLESRIEYTCIQHDEIVVSPTGAVGGLSCWEVVDESLKPVTVRVN